MSPLLSVCVSHVSASVCLCVPCLCFCLSVSPLACVSHVSASVCLCVPCLRRGSVSQGTLQIWSTQLQTYLLCNNNYSFFSDTNAFKTVYELFIWNDNDSRMEYWWRVLREFGENISSVADKGIQRLSYLHTRFLFHDNGLDSYVGKGTMPSHLDAAKKDRETQKERQRERERKRDRERHTHGKKDGLSTSLLAAYFFWVCVFVCVCVRCWRKAEKPPALCSSTPADVTDGCRLHPHPHP